MILRESRLELPASERRPAADEVPPRSGSAPNISLSNAYALIADEQPSTAAAAKSGAASTAASGDAAES